MNKLAQPLSFSMTMIAAAILAVIIVALSGCGEGEWDDCTCEELFEMPEGEHSIIVKKTQYFEAGDAQ